VKYSIVHKVKKKNSCKGLIIAFKLNDSNGDEYILCGHSLCTTSGLNKDQYKSDVAYKLAIGRAIKKFGSKEYDVPQSIKKDFDKVCKRIKSYFKTGMLPVWYSNTFVDDKEA
jgi:hypothetical protein